MIQRILKSMEPKQTIGEEKLVSNSFPIYSKELTCVAGGTREPAIFRGEAAIFSKLFSNRLLTNPLAALPPKTNTLAR